MGTPEESGQSTERLPWHGTDMWGVFLLSVGMWFLAGKVLQTWLRVDAPSLASFSALLGFFLVAGAIFWSRYVRRTHLSLLFPIRLSISDLLLGLALGVVLHFLAVGLTDASMWIGERILGRPPVGPHLELTVTNTASLVVFALGLIVAAPIGEEVFFRSYVFRGLLPRGRAFAYLASAGAFALYHLFPLRFFFTFVGGLLLAGALDRRRNLLVPIVAHATANIWALVVVGKFLAHRAGL